jgi:hypothetical protein
MSCSALVALAAGYAILHGYLIRWSSRLPPEPHGFEVKQILGKTPGAEEKDIDHG